ncbi:hypothetical protein VTK73DRAFT_7276 [Phialemonium thermophilum]|uniref:Uncharacterized protein n=1 Tax=Phialemonium thermophilum TaxID=223376 RepID=A0ABR3WFD0_9PEZI
MDGANGSVNGSWAMNGMNGSVKPSFKARNEQPTRQRTSPPPGSGILSRSFAVFARLLTWYAILTILFRCPATIEKCDETTPKICKPYFQVKQVVSPHLQPYYDAYAAPYVEIVRPYYDVVDRTVVAPGWGYATKYGAPRVAQAQAHSRAVWEKNVQPQLQRYQGLAKDQYDQSLAPYVSRVTSTMAPYYDLAKTNAMQTYYEFLLPSYEYVRPYALQGYRATSGFVMGQVVPTAAWTWNKTYIFLDGTVWPQIRAAYLENVEPQLVKISQRLGRHKDKVSTLKSAVGSGSGR